MVAELSAVKHNTQEADARMLHLYTRVAWQVAEFKDRLRRQKGQGMVEYGLIIALVAIVLVAALTALNGGLKTVFGTITNTLNAN
jgi:pilus assembly protein Flp/PilA